MKKDTKKSITRREFISQASAAAAAVSAFTIVPRHVLGGPKYTAPSDKLNIACIGIGGKGGSDIYSVRSENIVALCDVDYKRGARTFKRYPKAKQYKDFRIMLEKEDKNIDAVMVSTPDHTHAVAAMMAIKMDKHVYCQKPLAHDMYEVRALTEEARKRGVVTQMGIQIHATNEMKFGVEMIKSGIIGKVRRVDVWSSKRARKKNSAAIDKVPQGRPQGSMPVPDTLDWDLWLGPAPYRPYNRQYAPGSWRRWWDFGVGGLGDMGCHIMDPAFWALDLKSPITVEAHPGPFNKEVYPSRTTVQWEFPARGEQPPVTMTWYGGSDRPFIPSGLLPQEKMPNQGGLYYGDKGILLFPHRTLKTPAHIRPTLLPTAKMKDCPAPKQLFERNTDHYMEWVKACKGGPKTSADFDYSGPLTETVLLGNLAARTGQRIFWDTKKFEITNIPEANKYLKREYRKGWKL